MNRGLSALRLHTIMVFIFLIRLGRIIDFYLLELCFMKVLRVPWGTLSMGQRVVNT